MKSTCAVSVGGGSRVGYLAAHPQAARPAVKASATAKGASDDAKKAALAKQKALEEAKKAQLAKAKAAEDAKKAQLAKQRGGNPSSEEEEKPKSSGFNLFGLFGEPVQVCNCRR